jgi:hypothetical protein
MSLVGIGVRTVIKINFGQVQAITYVSATRR